MSTEIVAILAIIGLIGYVVFFFGAKEPSHQHAKLLLELFGLCLVVMVVAGLFIQWPLHFWWDDLKAFYAVYGFAAFVFLIYAAKGLRLILQKDEDYYDKREVKYR
jgi:uncharacterized membrane protein